MILLQYCEKALQKAQYKKLDDGTWFADIEGFQGVWGNGLTVEECRQDLLEVLEEWLILKRNGKIREIWVFSKVVHLKKYGRKHLVIVHETLNLSDAPDFF